MLLYSILRTMITTEYSSLHLFVAVQVRMQLSFTGHWATEKVFSATLALKNLVAGWSIPGATPLDSNQPIAFTLARTSHICNVSTIPRHYAYPTNNEARAKRNGKRKKKTSWIFV